MLTVIHRVPNRRSSSMLDVTGEPLLLTQLAWLWREGATRIVVEVEAGAGAAGDAVRSWVLGHAAVPRGVVVPIASIAPLGPRALGVRAGLGEDVTLVAIPNNLAGSFCVSVLEAYARRSPFGVVAFFDPPPGFERRLRGGTVRVVRKALRDRVGPAVVRSAGWAACVDVPGEAAALTAALEDQELVRERESYAAWSSRHRAASAAR